MRIYKGEHINDIYLDMIQDISANPEYITKPRGQEIKEVLDAKIVLTNPRNCLITLTKRKLNYKFAMIEKFEYVAGHHRPLRLIDLNKNLGFFMNDVGIFDGHYGTRITYWMPYIIALLNKDPDTRQAVINIYGQQDRHASKDIPCTLTMQFFIREDKVHMIVTMRSNDVLWGVPYDTNAFCFLLECVAASLSREMGTYTLNAGSLHIYTEREKQLTDLLTDTETNSHKNPEITDCSFESIQDNLLTYLLSHDMVADDDEKMDPAWFNDEYMKEYVKEFNN